MKRIIIRISWLFGTLMTIFVLVILCSNWWLSNKWTDFYSQEEMIGMADSINESPKLPDNFYHAYDKIYPGQRGRSLSQSGFSIIWGLITNSKRIIEKTQCNCISATYKFDNKVTEDFQSWASYITAHGLENYTNEEKCLDFIYKQFDIQNHSEKYFAKPLDQLEYEEYLELILRLKSPQLYNKRPDLLAKRLSELIS